MYNPPFAFSMIAYNLSGFDFATAIPVIPHTPLGNPLLDLMEFQVSPPSVLLYKPEPSPPLSKL